MLEAVLKVRVPRSWLAEVSDRYGAKVRFIDRKPKGDYGIADLVEIDLRGGDLSKVVDVVRRNGFVRKVSVKSKTQSKALAVVETECVVCRTLANSSCFLQRAATLDDGSLEWDLILEDREALKKLTGDLSKYDCSVELAKISEVADEDALTKRQEEVLRVAFERGYFDYPKNIGIRELARGFHLSTSTVSEILRKGQKKILHSYIEEKRGGVR